MPDTVGDDEATAHQALSAAGLSVLEQCTPPGTGDPSYVESQSPAAGSTIPAVNPATNTASAVTLTFSCGPAPTTTTSTTAPPPTQP
ncbi:MAG TPA: PASTA domain-containing protein [Acidimicrobiales bacterium]|nr:PASTA domain-containing protein [Acidimicrobiales bacterium]